ncbi:MAG: CoA-binding protein [Bacteroidetes bacterium]|nr:MAG: CoA-binding protein [Bacteroidota bacterium]
MINNQLIAPESIVVVGGTNHLHKPGGRIIENLLDGKFKGKLHVVNPKKREVQGIEVTPSIEELPDVDLAILAIPAKYCLETVTYLARNKNTKAFIIISAGFGEVHPEGKIVEKQLAAVVNETGGCLFGPNCIGVITENYSGVFTPPIPEFHKDGCDFISASGSTALFIIEAGIPRGLRFANVFTVGNSAHTNVEDVLEYMDETFDPEKSSKIKLLYLENISNPEKLLKHAVSLVRKGCKIAAIKSGATDDGKRATASHTGAMANSDVAVRALFRKAGVVYCSSREELITVASIFSYKKLEGKNIAIITHAGGSAVMLTDALSRGGLKVPLIEGPHAEELKTYLAPGSSVSNPIDFLATGNAEQLGIIIDYCEHLFDHIDAMIVLFGSAGLFDVENVYKVLNVKLAVCKKPIYPILPSLINAKKEIQYFLSKGHVNFPDEVSLGRALTEVYHTPPPFVEAEINIDIDKKKIRTLIDEAAHGFLPPKEVKAILEAVHINVAQEYVVTTEKEALKAIKALGFPLAIKVVGPVHKSDLGGVDLNIFTEEEAMNAYKHMMSIEGATGVLIQPMLDGVELFIGAKHETAFGHIILCGIGGIFVEIFKDVRAGLAPIDRATAKRMIHKLQGYPLIKGARGRMGVNEEVLMDIIQSVSALVKVAPEIIEMDINPIIGKGDDLTAVDARIKVQKVNG